MNSEPNERDKNVGLRGISEQLPPNVIAEREVAICENTRDADTKTHPERVSETAVTETYSVGFALKKLKRYRMKLKLRYVVMYSAFFALSLMVLLSSYIAMMVLEFGHVTFIPSKRVLTVLAEHWFAFGLVFVTFLLASWILYRESARIFRTRRLVAYCEFSPEPGVTVTERAFVPSVIDRFQLLPRTESND